ncbi:hypothetical protein NX722_24790 [Endozoicomonas gorgoniicola]|uniref:WH2 domain-containing protein n=1 Tax=Endozoicomonas gorgoniicola TaxID=1234144 RepID=A0ABT3N2C2_9GAMM|nr:hypothetical protein [Endozoicomonas gorgoniicola]MCW7555784.1 hypothetical protein [Endozoicomonas gorgoniicola]
MHTFDTPVGKMLNQFASEHFGKGWEELDKSQRDGLCNYSASYSSEKGELKYVERAPGLVWGTHTVEGSGPAAERVMGYMKTFADEYSTFSGELGKRVSLPTRKISKDCTIKELSDLKILLDEWASQNKGKALQVAKETCTGLNNAVVNQRLFRSDSAEDRSNIQEKIQNAVISAVVAGSEVAETSKGITQYLVSQATKVKKQVVEGDSTYFARDTYLKISQNAQRLAAHIDAIKADVEIEDYEKVLKVLFRLDSAVQQDLGDSALFDSTVKELIASFPNNKEGVKGAHLLASMSLNPMNESVKSKLNTICEQSLNAQIEVARRKNRTIKTGIPHILNQMAMRYEVEQKNGQKTDSRSPDYQHQSSISFDELPEHMQENLGKKVAALHKPEDNGTVYSFDDVGYGLRSVEGADLLASSVQKNAGGAIDKINALAEAAGFESSFEPLEQTNRYLVSELIALNDKLAVWAKENPYLMDLNEYEEELSGLALRKSSDSESAQAVQRDIDACLNKIITACVDGGVNSPAAILGILGHLNTKAYDWRDSAGTQAKSSCDYIANRTKELGHTVKHLQEIQKAKPDVITKLDGKAFVAIIAELTSLRDSCADQSQKRHGLVKALDSFRESVGSSNEFDRSYWQTLNTLMEAGLPAEESAGIIRDQLAGIPDIDTGGLLKGMAETLPLIPCTNPVNKEYVSLVRSCSTYINDLREAGKNIEQSEKAKEAINQFAAELIQQPNIVSTDEALKRIEKWIEGQAASGELFQATGSVLSQWTGYAQYYDRELKETTANISRLCRDFDAQRDEFDKPGNYGKFVPSKWVNDKSLTAELSQAFIKRGRLSDQEESGAFSGNNLPPSPSPSPPTPTPAPAPAPTPAPAPPPPPPPPLPPLPKDRAAANNKKTEVAGQKPETAIKQKSAARASTSGVRLPDFNPATVLLKKTGRDTTGNLGGNNSEKKATPGLIDEIKNAGGKVKNNSPRLSSETIQPEELRRKELEASQRSLNRQLNSLKDEVARLEGLLKKGSDDKGVENVHKRELDEAKKALKEFHKKNPHYEKGTLTNVQLTKQLSLRNEDPRNALEIALRKRAEVMLHSLGPESLSDQNDDWSL